MNFSLFTARRLVLGKKSFSSLIIRIGIAAVAVSLAVMLIATCIMMGYKREITDRITGFSSHVVVSALDFNESFEADPIPARPDYLEEVKAMPLVQNVQEFAHKAGIIKTEAAIEGIIIKGVGSDQDWSFLDASLVKGRHFIPNDSQPSNEIMLSKYTSDKLQLDTGDKVNIIFLNNQNQPPRVRRFTICGIFMTGLENYDRTYAIADIGHVKRLYGWPEIYTQGFEIKLSSFDRLDENTDLIKSAVGPELQVRNARELKPQIFDWLGLLDTNVIIILGLMIVVAVINMITAILILIFERTNMIGLLKALGSSDRQVRNIFLWKAAYLIIQGLFWGNLFGLGLGYIQMKTGFIPLDAESYYLHQVPFYINLWYVLLINAVTFVLCLFMLLLPARMISRISPVKAIRFE